MAIPLPQPCKLWRAHVWAVEVFVVSTSECDPHAGPVQHASVVLSPHHEYTAVAQTCTL